MRILMMPHKDYHAETMYKISLELNDLGIESVFLHPVEKYSNMGVKDVAEKYNFYLISNDELLAGTINPDAVLVMNDWDMASRPLLDYCHDNYIPVIGLQEGICDFRRENWIDKYYNDPNRLPYSYCDCLMLCSEFDATYFPDTPHSIVGMERVEKLYSYNVSFPAEILVLININFSFNVCTEFSRQWLVDVTKACDECGFRYIISRHPQDETDITGYEDYISEKPLHELIAESTVFVSRFSNAIYESLIMGKPAIYYNFHQEKSRYFNETMGAFTAVYYQEDIKNALIYEANQREIRTRAKQYLDYHVAYKPDISSAKRSAKGISEFMRERNAQLIAYKKAIKSEINVSIIVPIYNTKEYLAQCLGSLISQTMRDIEIICVDDCSSDGSHKIVEDYQQLDKRIKLFRFKQNKGQGAARNFGLEQASGNAILFVDSDDWIMPELCEEVYGKMIITQSEVVIFNYFNSYPNKIEIAEGINFDNLNSLNFSRDELLKCCGVFKMYAHNFLQDNSIRYPEGIIYEDWFWTMQWATRAQNIVAIDKPYYFYRQSREGSTVTSSNKKLILNDIIKNIDMSVSYLKHNNDDIKNIYTFVNKMDCQTSRLAIGKEKDELEEIIYNYLKKLFPHDLPKEIISPSIKNIYNKRSTEKDSTNRSEYRIEKQNKISLKQMLRTIWKRILKPVYIRTSPVYRTLWRLEGSIEELRKQESYSKKRIENELAQIRSFEKKVDNKLDTFTNKLEENRNNIIRNSDNIRQCQRIMEECNNSNQVNQFCQIIDYNKKMINNVADQIEKLHQTIDTNKEMINSNSDEVRASAQDNNANLNLISKKIELLNDTYSSNLKTLFELQDIVYFESNIIGDGVPNDGFLNNINIPMDDQQLRMVHLYGKEIRFSDPISFWCIYKELYVNEDYYINYDNDSPRILDCGAHIGLASIYIKHKYPRARITAFEPDPNNFSLLKQNFESFDFNEIEIIEKAVGDKEGITKFYRAPDMSMGGSVTTRMGTSKRKLEEFDVSMCRLRDYIINDKIDFLKLDVEGIEDKIIIDCQDCIKNVNYLFIEFHVGAGLNMSRIIKILDVLNKSNFIYNVTKSDSYKKNT